MRIPRNSSRAAISCVGVFMLFLTTLSAGCSGDGQNRISGFPILVLPHIRSYRLGKAASEKPVIIESVRTFARARFRRRHWL